jgi:hypothetical protein
MDDKQEHCDAWAGCRYPWEHSRFELRFARLAEAKVLPVD